MAHKEPYPEFQEGSKYNLKIIKEKKRIIKEKKRIMGARRIDITDYDIKRLNKLVEADYKLNKRDKKYLKELEKELRRAKVVASKKISQKVITMNSKVRTFDQCFLLYHIEEKGLIF